jgi:hypothetical protein
MSKGEDIANGAELPRWTQQFHNDVRDDSDLIVVDRHELAQTIDEALEAASARIAWFEQELARVRGIARLANNEAEDTHRLLEEMGIYNIEVSE